LTLAELQIHKELIQAKITKSKKNIFLSRQLAKAHLTISSTCAPNGAQMNLFGNSAIRNTSSNMMITKLGN